MLLHAVNAIVLWFVLRRLALPGAWAAAAIFALHPVNVESAAWITERKNVLSGMFYLLALLSYLRFRQTPRRGPYFAAAGLFVCALLSKTATCTFPLVMAVLLWWRHGRIRRRDLLALAPFVVVGALAGSLTAWLEVHHAGAGGDVWALSWAEKILVAGRALWFYASKLLWPAQLTFIYPRWDIDAGALGQYLFPMGAAAVGIMLWAFRGRLGRGPLTAMCVFAITLSPALGFFRVFFMRYAYVQDHFQYLAGVGLIALATAIVAQAVARAGGAGRWIGMGGVSGVLVVLAALTWSRAHVFHDSERLWRDSLSKNPEAWLPHNNLGLLLAEQGNYHDAVQEYKQALRIRPSYPETYFNLGYALIALDMMNEGIERLRQGLNINPEYPEVYYSIGYYLARQGRLDASIAAYREALGVEPFHREAHIALGDALLTASRYDEALEHYRSAVDRHSPFASDYNNLANLMLRTGRPEDAERYYRAALRRDPEYADAHFNLGTLLHVRGDIRGAAGAFEAALRADPNRARAAFNLGAVLQEGGDTEGALAAYEAAVEADSGLAAAHYNLGTLLERRGEPGRAVQHLRRAVEIQPDFAGAHHNLAIALFRTGEVAASWHHAHAAKRLGEPMSPQFLRALEDRLPEPAEGVLP